MTRVYRSATLRGAGIDLRLTSQEAPDDVVESHLTGLDGWFGGVGVSDPGEQRKLGHGFYATPSLRSSRELTLNGTLIFTDERNRLIADRFLSGLLWDGEFGELEVTTDELTLTSRVKLSGEIKHAYTSERSLSVQIPLTAPDPFLYAPARSYQIFPAGAGEGLRFPAFGSGGGVAGESLGVLESAYTPLADLPEGAAVGFRTDQRLTGVAVKAPGTVPGKVYRVRWWVRALGDGTKGSLRVNHIGGPSYSAYWLTPTMTFTAGEWVTGETTLTMPAGNALWLYPFTNHSSGGVGVQEWAFDLREVTPALDWGAGAPLGGIATNAGNATAYPVYTVHGSWPAGFRITTGQTAIEYPAPVHPSAPVRIDNRTGEVMVAGMDQTYRLTRRDWVSVPAGAGVQPRITGLAPSTGWCDVQIQDTYI